MKKILLIVCLYAPSLYSMEAENNEAYNAYVLTHSIVSRIRNKLRFQEEFKQCLNGETRDGLAYGENILTRGHNVESENCSLFSYQCASALLKTNGLIQLHLASGIPNTDALRSLVSLQSRLEERCPRNAKHQQDFEGIATQRDYDARDHHKWLTHKCRNPNGDALINYDHPFYCTTNSFFQAALVNAQATLFDKSGKASTRMRDAMRFNKPIEQQQ